MQFSFTANLSLAGAEAAQVSDRDFPAVRL
jgi:hypothetical protein